MKIIEATLIFPMTIIIVCLLIGLTMHFYEALGQQIENQAEILTEACKTSEISYINGINGLIGIVEE